VIDVAGDDAPFGRRVVIEKSREESSSGDSQRTTTANASERLAIRTSSSAFELSRSDMSGKEPHHERSQSPRSTPSREVSSRVDEASERIGFGLVRPCSQCGPRGPAILPAVHVDGKVRTWLGMHAELAGFGSRPTVATKAGNARLAQQYGISALLPVSLGPRSKPFRCSISGSASHFGAGEADAPRQGQAARDVIPVGRKRGAGLRLPVATT